MHGRCSSRVDLSDVTMLRWPEAGPHCRHGHGWALRTDVTRTSSLASGGGEEFDLAALELTPVRRAGYVSWRSRQCGDRCFASEMGRVAVAVMAAWTTFLVAVAVAGIVVTVNVWH